MHLQHVVSLLGLSLYPTQGDKGKKAPVKKIPKKDSCFLL